MVYGGGEYCKTAGPNGTSECGLAKGTGISLLILGGVLLGLAAGETTQASGTAAPPVQEPAAHSMPLVQESSSVSSTAQEVIEQIRSQPHGIVPPLQTVGRCSGSVAIVSVQNGTDFTLYLYLVGPRSNTYTLSPGGKLDLRLPTGSYDVGARVTAAHVLPFAGVWRIAGCQYESLFYIQ